MRRDLNEGFGEIWPPKELMRNPLNGSVSGGGIMIKDFEPREIVVC